MKNSRRKWTNLKKPWNNPDAYIRFNFIALVGLLLLFILLFLGTDSGWLTCPFNELGRACQACGLTRDIKDIVSGGYDSELINDSSIWIFTLLTGQVLLRIILTMLSIRGRKAIFILDAFVFFLMLLSVVVSLFYFN